ncbi:hypothetical protein VTP01DRAFT_5103 [Rhizomucor pusillus]|uniref:uncharacterized protein n=1 Tax=Rhizomucor pusillus TaxID=4840 RepID=UPI0037424E1C
MQLRPSGNKAYSAGTRQLERRDDRRMKSLQHFHSLLRGVYEASFQSPPQPDQSIDQLLTLLNTKIDLPVKGVSDQQIIDTILSGCKAISYESNVCSSFCKFTFRQYSKQIRLASLRLSQFEVCINYLLNGLENAQDVSFDLRVDMLRVLSALVFENASNASKFNPRLSDILLKLADRSTKPFEVRRMAINCIGNLCAGAGTKLQTYYKDYYRTLLSNLAVVEQSTEGTLMIASNALDFSDSAVRKIASSTLRALHFLLSQDKTLVTNPLCDIIDIVHTFIFMSVSTKTYNSTRDESSTGRGILPARSRLSQTSITPRPQLSWRMMPQKSTGLTSSDSEMSDSSDSTAANPRRQRDDAKIRINSLLCLQAIANTTPRVLYPQWHRFIPDTFSIFLLNNTDNQGELLPYLASDNQSSSLFTILLYDPMTTVRIAVCNTLISMLDASKQYLSVASDRETKSSFTSLSERLASILRDLHAAVRQALRKEASEQVLQVILQLIQVLVANCPYDRLAPDYLPQLYRALWDLWPRASLNVRCSVLDAISSILEAAIEVPESIQNPLEADTLSLLQSLVQTVTEQSSSNSSSNLHVAVWHTLAAMARFRFSMVSEEWSTLEIIFENSLKDTNASVRVSALKFAESYACALAEKATKDKDSYLEKGIDWWTTLLAKHIQNSCIDEDPAVRAATCDCLASISECIYEHMKPSSQRLAIALLLPLPEDEDLSVRAAACRGLGVFVTFASLRSDSLFVSNMVSCILERMKDANLLVRVRASWALGNMCDALVVESDSPGFKFSDWISLETWTDVLDAASSASLDNDKLRSNAVRAMGSLLQVTPAKVFEYSHTMNLVKKAMAGLVKNVETGSLKTRWNACHAASNMLKNASFPIGYVQASRSLYPWTVPLYTALTRSLNQCRNYKVKINACLALATPSDGGKYGDDQLFTAVYQAVEQAKVACETGQEENFQEYRYKEQLKQQVSEALLHLSSIQLSRAK